MQILDVHTTVQLPVHIVTPQRYVTAVHCRQMLLRYKQIAVKPQADYKPNIVNVSSSYEEDRQIHAAEVNPYCKKTLTLSESHCPGSKVKKSDWLMLMPRHPSAG